jgi:hypothetical protein
MHKRVLMNVRLGIYDPNFNKTTLLESSFNVSHLFIHGLTWNFLYYTKGFTSIMYNL